jgi:hypothetical protein
LECLDNATSLNSGRSDNSNGLRVFGDHASSFVVGSTVRLSADRASTRILVESIVGGLVGIYLCRQ